MSYAIIGVLAFIGIMSFILPKILKAKMAFVSSAEKKYFEETRKKISDNTEMSDDLLTSMQIYNEFIFENNQEYLSETFPEDVMIFETKDITNENISIFGQIIIPRSKTTRIRKQEKEQKDIVYPICLEATRANLRSGFSILPNTSIPLGNENSLSVLYGYPKEKLISKNKYILKKGDTIIIKTLFNEDKYIIYDLAFISDEDISNFYISEGKCEIIIVMYFNANSSNEKYCIYARKVKKE